MQGAGGVVEILAGGVNEQEGAGGEARPGREGPAGGKVDTIREVPAAEINRGGSGVVNLDPIRTVTICESEGVLIAGHEFADDLPLSR